MNGFNHSHAVLIGIDNYKNAITPLRTAVNDARAIGSVLAQRHQYSNVCLLLNEEATLAGLKSYLAEELPRQIQRDDRLLFYFAGHGIALNDDASPVGYLIPQDAKQQAVETFLPMQFVHDALVALECRHMLAIFDCCFAGAFRWVTTRQFRLNQPEIYQERYARYISDPAWQVITSAAHDQQALDILGKRYQIGRREEERAEINADGCVEHSPFAQALLAALTQGEADTPPGDGVVTATDLYVYLRNRVEPEGPNGYLRQTPGLWPLKKHDKGEYIFVFPDKLKPLPSAVKLNKENNPYRGLEAYEEKHKDLFFGREALLETLYKQVAQQPFTNVLGPSGIGKSSLVKAGLLPMLKAATDQAWTVVDPIRPSQQPLRALRELALPDGVPAGDAIATGAPTASGAIELSQRLDAWFALHPDRQLVLVIDQLEELFTLCDNAEERRLFLTQLIAASRGHQARLRIITTLRLDFEPRAVQLADGPDLVHFDWAQTRFIVSPLTHNELREVIEQPAAARVLFFEPSSLVDELIYEVAQMPGALPLLSFTLSELYLKSVASAREDRTLKRADYDALGGVVGSLKHRADEEYGALADDQQRAMKNVMLRMVSLEGGELARRRVYASELRYDDKRAEQRVNEVINRLVAARLVVSGQDPQGKIYVEPAHDALVRGWPQLSKWIEETQIAQDNLLLRRRLTQAAELWQTTEAQSNQQNRLMGWVRQRLPEEIGSYALPPVEPRSGLLWADTTRSTLLTTILNADRQWMSRDEAEFARKSIERHALNQRIRQIAISGLIALTTIALVTALIAIDRWTAATRNLREEQRSTSLRQSIQSTAQLIADPVASLHLALAGLPRPGRIRPYVPQSELALTRALRASLERAFLDFTAEQSTVVLTDKQVAWSAELIAVGGDGLHLVSPTLTAPITLTDPTTMPVQGVAWGENGLLLSYDKQTVTVWRGTEKSAEHSFTDALACAQWQPGGTQIAVCSGQRLWLWQPADDTVQETPTFPRNVKAARWSRNGEFVAAWDVGNTLQVRQVATGEALPVPEPEPPSPIGNVAWAPDSRHLVVAATDGMIRLINVAAPAQLAASQAYTEPQQINAHFIDNTHFVTWALAEAVQLWTIGAAVPYTFNLGNDVTENVLFLAEQQDLLILMADGAAQRWDLTQEEPSRTARLSGHTGKILAADLDTTGRYLATSSVDGTARLWDVTTQTLLTTLYGHVGPTFDERADVLGVRWQDAQHVVTYGADGSLRRWQVLDARHEPLCNGTDVERLPRCFDANGTFYAHANSIHFARWLDDHVLITAGRDGAAGRLDLAAAQPAVQILPPVSTEPIAPTVLWDPAGRRVFTYVKESALTPVAASASEHTVVADSAGVVRDFATGAVIARIPGRIEEAFWPAAGLLLSDVENNVRLVDWQTGTVMQVFAGYQSPILAAQQYGDAMLATGEAAGMIRIWQLLTNEPPLLLNNDIPQIDRLPVTGLQWSKDGSRLLSTGRVIMLWDVANGTRRWQVADIAYDKTYAAFSPDEALVATAIGPAITVLDAASGTVLWAEEKEHDQPVLGVAWLVGPTWPYQQAAWRRPLTVFAENERLLLLTWSGDGTARVWDGDHDGDGNWDKDAQNGSEIMRMTDIGLEGIGAAVVSPDGKRIVTTTSIFTTDGPQGLIRLWQTWYREPEKLLATGPRYLTRPLSSVQKKVFVIE